MTGFLSHTTPVPHGTNTARCPVVVQSLSSRCPVDDWTTTGQRLDNDWTTSGVGTVRKRLFSSVAAGRGLFAGIRIVVSLLFILALFQDVYAQRIVQNGIQFRHSDSRQMSFGFTLTDIRSDACGDRYSSLTSPATNSFSTEIGKPMLPVYRQIIEIPNGGDPIITIDTVDWKTLALSGIGCPDAVRPMAPASIKSAGRQEPVPDSSIYGQDLFYGDDIVSIRSLGTMRGRRLAMLTIAPVRYNDALRQVQVCRHLAATVTVSGKHIKGNLQPLQGNPLAENGEAASKAYTNILAASDVPITYLIVSPPKFREVLQPFIAWKRQEGFRVEEYYCESSNKEAIKSHLQQRYDNATPSHPAPLFILLAGDVQEIGVWNAQHNIEGLLVHQTDLYYAEFTGDYLPDALIGRLSASDTATMRQIIDKTLSYERFMLADSSYLSRSLLVAGKEETEPAPTVTNGQVNYLKSCIIEHDSQHDTICFYNPSSDTLGEAIEGHIRQGVGLINYTAHCIATSWLYPRISQYFFDTLPANGSLFIAVNNCCRANEIIGDCLGEHLLRKGGSGAVGVIGASNETLWNEDYYWSVGGEGNPSLFPQYHAGLEGAYDRLFHTHGTAPAEHAPTMGQMLTAGNWAVTASGSPYDAYYWEIYSLLGDPSLMPYIGIPDTQWLAVDTVREGDVTIGVHGTPGARVAATWNDTLWGVCTLDGNGDGLMHTSRPVLDTLLLTATAQFHRPLQAIITPSPYEGARLVVADVAVHDGNGIQTQQLTLCDSATISATVRNVGEQPAIGHFLSLNTSNRQTVSELLPHQDTTIQFVIYPETDCDWMRLDYATGDSATYWQMQQVLDILSPRVELASVALTCNGALVSTFTPNTEHTLQIAIANRGRGNAKELSTRMTANGNDTIASLGTLGAGDTARCQFSLTVNGTEDSLAVGLQIMHRADTITVDTVFLRDTTLAIRPVQESAMDVKIYPNPASNIVTFSGFRQPTHITIYDVYGRTMDDFFAQSGQIIQYSTQELRCGIYSILFSETQHGAPMTRQTKRLLIAR